MAELQYSERLAILGTETHELRRLKADLMYIYKIVFGLLDVEHGTFYIKLKGGTSTGPEHTAMRSVLKILTAESLHAFKVAPVWNCLPANATNFKTIHAFKESLNKIDFNPQLTSK